MLRLFQSINVTRVYTLALNAQISENPGILLDDLHVSLNINLQFLSTYKAKNVYTLQKDAIPPNGF